MLPDKRFGTRDDVITSFGTHKYGFTSSEDVAIKGKRLFIVSSRQHYILETDAKDEFLEFGAKMGTGAVKSKELSSVGIELEEIHYDFSVRRLHIETLAKMLAGMKAAYAKPLTNALEINKVVLAPMKEQGLELLKYDPEFSFDRVGIVTPEGDGYLKGVITLKGATAEDFA